MGRKEEKLQILKNKCDEINYILLTKEYINNKTKLDIICDKGHEWHPTFDNFINKDRRCRKCADIQNGINQRLSWEEVLNRVETYGYKMLSTEDEYINQDSRLKDLCPNGHEYEFYISNFQQGKRCRSCLMSGGEQEIANIGIEFDGQQHFHIQFGKNLLDLMNQRYIDNIKTQYCKDNNIKLIRIPYWNFDKIEEILIKELDLK